MGKLEFGVSWGNLGMGSRRNELFRTRFLGLIYNACATSVCYMFHLRDSGMNRGWRGFEYDV